MDTDQRKCFKCKKHKGKRYCIRENKHICWVCCNDHRIDTKCPTECEYHLSNNAKPAEIPIKTDSLSEFRDFISKHTQVWLSKANSLFGDKIPILMKDTAAGKAELIKKLLSLKMDKTTAETCEKTLEINLNAKDIPYKKIFEDIAIEFLNSLIEPDWDTIKDYFLKKDYTTIEKYIEILQNRKEIKDLYTYIVLSSGTSKDGKEAFCSVEINHKYDISLLFANIDDVWYIDNILFGEINLLYTEPDSIRHIAFALSKSQFDRAWQLIKQSEEIFCFSPDIQYYKGLYYSLKAMPDEALNAFQEATILDTNFVEAYYNMAFIHHSKTNIEKAESLYKKVIELNENYINAINNLGTIYLHQKKQKQAKELFEKCLKIDPEFKFAIENIKKCDE